MSQTSSVSEHPGLQFLLQGVAKRQRMAECAWQAPHCEGRSVALRHLQHGPLRTS